MRYSVRTDSGSKTVDLDIYDRIGASFFDEGVSAKAVRKVLAENQDAKLIRVNINSRGGDPLDGFAIYNDLVAHPADVETNITGIAASAASVIAMAGDKIRAANTSMVMIHNASGGSFGEAKDLRAMADVLDKIGLLAADVYAERTGISQDAALRLMGSETWMTAKEAKRRGFVDEIVPAKKQPQARAQMCADLTDITASPDLMSALLRTQAHYFAPVENSATVGYMEVDGIDIDVEEETMPPEQTPAKTPAAPAATAPATPDFAAALAAALGPIVAELKEVKSQLAAGTASQTSADSATFAARVNAACEKHISASKLTNTPESRSFFLAQAKDEAALAALDAHYTAQPPIVMTTSVNTTVVTEGSGPKLGPQALKLCKDMGWDPSKLYSKD